MKRTFIIATALSAGAFTTATAGPDSPDALAEAFCAGVIAEDANALGNLYTEDADSYGPGGSIVKGREAIVASWAPFFDGYDNITCEIEKQGEKKNKKNHTAWGLWTMTGTPADGGDAVTMKGRFMDISVKTKEGWLYRADHASMMAAPEEAPAEE